MIVDSHAGTRKMIRKFLDLPGMSFCECASGDEALIQGRKFKPNWITLEADMPGLDGFQSALALRAEHPLTGIFIVTGECKPHFRNLSNSLGAFALICMENLMAVHMMLSNELSRSISATVTSEIRVSC
jgi:DNA-binding response OmpR family regulator